MVTPRAGVRLLGRRSERAALDGLVAAVRAGESRALVVRGDPGVGKSALLGYVAERATGCRVVHAVGVESEMELAFAGLHQLCAPLLDRLEHLPAPQRDALATAFGVRAGEAPDRFLVSLAVLSLLGDAAEERPLVCLVDDAQWLDRASAQVVAFVARRVLAESIALVFASRESSDDGELSGLPQLVVEGLGYDDARALLRSVVAGPLDDRVGDRIIAETAGNPLALLELPRGRNPAELAGGFGLPRPGPLSARIEQSFARRVERMPETTQRLLVIAAAEPIGDPTLLYQAAAAIGVDVDDALTGADDLITIDDRARFRHPLVRAAVYGGASVTDRRRAHAALAEATDPQLDPDRRAWHLAQATPAPDEQVAEELERSAGRALARGGVAAAAAFLDRAAKLTPERARRARRLLAAARAKRDAGALDAALELLGAVEAGPVDALQAAELEELRGQIAFDQRRVGDAVRLLISAARRFEALDAASARTTHLEAIGAAMWAGDLERPGAMREAAASARGAPPSAESPGAADLLLDALAIRLTDGYAAAAPALRQALDAVLALEPVAGEVGRWLWLAGSRASGSVALELWDADSAHTLASRQVQVARDAGALVQLQFALNFLARSHILEGDLAAAAGAIEEERTIAAATGRPAIAYTEMMLAAWRGAEAPASESIARELAEASAYGQGRIVNFADYATAVLCNGLGRYEAALDAARRAFERDHISYLSFVVPELAEAASRTGHAAVLQTALERVSECARVTPGDWVLGIEAGVRALASDGDAADRSYRESIERLARTRVRVELARAQLLYGEWLRRENRRVDAREQLRAAHEAFVAMGAGPFADRAARELLATGETVRKRTVETRDELTPHEAQIARLAGDGFTNSEIGAQLFLSPRTVEWHLRKVFGKLGITSRRELRSALPDGRAAVVHA